MQKFDGDPDEWLALQAGMPLYPAVFGRDAITAGWQAAFVDRGEALAAALNKLGKLQSDGFDAWRDEQPGRIPYQVRTPFFQKARTYLGVEPQPVPPVYSPKSCRTSFWRPPRGRSES